MYSALNENASLVSSFSLILTFCAVFVQQTCLCMRIYASMFDESL